MHGSGWGGTGSRSGGRGRGRGLCRTPGAPRGAQGALEGASGSHRNLSSVGPTTRKFSAAIARPGAGCRGAPGRRCAIGECPEGEGRAWAAGQAPSMSLSWRPMNFESSKRQPLPVHCTLPLWAPRKWAGAAASPAAPVSPSGGSVVCTPGQPPPAWAIIRVHCGLIRAAPPQQPPTPTPPAA